MATLSYSSDHSSVKMLNCSTFADVYSYINLVVILLVLLCLILSQKRLSFPFLLFNFCQKIYLIGLVNYLKDECLQNILISLNHYFFSGTNHLFLSDTVLVASDNFVYQVGHYKHVISNMISMNWIVLFGITICIIFVLLNFLVLLKSHNNNLLNFSRLLTKSFIFKIPLIFCEFFFKPALLFIMIVMVDLSNSSVGSIISAILYTIVVIIYFWFTLFILNTYLDYYLSYGFLNRFGGIYEFVAFYSKKDLQFFMNEKKLSYKNNRFQNILRNHLNRQKAFSCFEIIVVILNVNTSNQIVPLIFLFLFNLIEIILFVFIKSKNNSFYFYTKKADVLFYVNSFSLFLIHICAIINTTAESLSLVIGMIIIIVFFLNFTLILAFGIYELCISQNEDSLWKIKKDRLDQSRRKEQYIKNLLEEEDNLRGHYDSFKNKFNDKTMALLAKNREKKKQKKTEEDKFSFSKPNKKYDFLEEKYKVK